MFFSGDGIWCPNLDIDISGASTCKRFFGADAKKMLYAQELRIASLTFGSDGNIRTIEQLLGAHTKEQPPDVRTSV